MNAAEPKPRPIVKRASNVVTPTQIKWHGRLAAAAVHVVIRTLASTLRFSCTGSQAARDLLGVEPSIFATWHNRLVLSLPAYHRMVSRKTAGRRLAAMVSASRDGALVARVLQRFDVEPVRGSSSRRGPQALRELVSYAEKGFDLAITPDGPRGPCYKVQEGAIALAQLTQLPIIPASDRLGWKVRLKSWDRFQIPLPFSTWNLRLGDPLRVPRDADAETRETLRLELERRLKSLTVD